jgi:single-strand DNA-binding protein
MKRSLNRVTLVGNAGGDPQLKPDRNGKLVATFSLATTDGYLPKGAKDWVNETTWHNIVSFNDSQYMADMIRKGDTVAVFGRIRNNTVGEGDQRKTYSSIVCEQFTVQPKVEHQDQTQDPSQSHGEMPASW